jgi:hypothetical protein
MSVPRRMQVPVFGFVLAMSLSLPSQAFAEGTQCPNGHLVQSGDPQPVVQLKCGNPDSKNSRVERRGPRWVTVDEWFYQGTASRFHRVLVFENGILVRAMEVSRGSPRANVLAQGDFRSFQSPPDEFVSRGVPIPGVRHSGPLDKTVPGHAFSPLPGAHASLTPHAENKAIAPR